eukprot:gene10760-3379_t
MKHTTQHHKKHNKNQKPDTSQDENLAKELQNQYEKELNDDTKFDEEIAQQFQHLNLQQQCDFMGIPQEINFQQQFHLQQQRIQQQIREQQLHFEQKMLQQQREFEQRRQRLLNQHQQQMRFHQQQLEQTQNQIQQSLQQNHSIPRFNFNFHNSSSNSNRQIGPNQFQLSTNLNGIQFDFQSSIQRRNDSYEDLLHFQESMGNVSRGVQKEDIENSTSKFKLQKIPQDDDSCVICCEDFQKNEIVRKLPCMHLFHCECIDKWFDQSKNCPLCKKDILDK